MANTSYGNGSAPYAEAGSVLSRTHWGGPDADRDLHIEMYEKLIDQSFAVDSLFRSSGLTNFKSTQNQSNTYRGDRIGNVAVKGRKSGEALDVSRIQNEKFLITVDTVSYVASAVDYQDDWTSPDFQQNYAFEHAVAHAKSFDTAHMIKLIHATNWVADTNLTNFSNGIVKDCSSWGGASPSNKEEKADILVDFHSQCLEDFTKRDLGGSLAEFVTLVRPEVFTLLMNHKKLMNVQFMGNEGYNNFAMRRVAMVNGIRIIETPRFPTKNTAITNHHLGSAFNLTQALSNIDVLIFNPRLTLLTVEAKPMTVDFWNDKPNFANRLDSYTMYTVGVRRGDACAGIKMPTTY